MTGRHVGGLEHVQLAPRERQVDLLVGRRAPAGQHGRPELGQAAHGPLGIELVLAGDCLVATRRLKEGHGGAVRVQGVGEPEAALVLIHVPMQIPGHILDSF